MNPPKLSLRFALIGVFVILNVSAVGVIGLLSFANTQQSNTFIIGRLQQDIFNRVTHYIEDLFRQAENINLSNAHLIRKGLIAPDDSAALGDLFLQKVDISGTVSSIFFGTPEGGFTAAGQKAIGNAFFLVETDSEAAGVFRIYDTDSSGTKTGVTLTETEFDARTRPWYTRALDAPGNVWSPPFTVTAGQEKAIAVNLAVRDPENKLMGVLSTNIFIAHLNRYLQSLADRENGRVYIVDRSGELIASSLTEESFSDCSWNSYETETHLKNRILTQIGTTRNPAAHSFTTHINGNAHHVYVAPILASERLGWFAVIEFPECSFLPYLKSHNSITLFTIFVTLGMTIVTGLVATRWITRPISLLEDAAQKIARGIWHTTKLPPSQIREIDGLSTSFQNMSETLEQVVLEFQEEINVRRETEEHLKASEASLRVRSEMYQKLTDAAKDAIIQMSPAGEIVFWNHAAENIFGYCASEVLGKSAHALLAQDADLQRFVRAFPEFIATGTGKAIGRTLELDGIHKDGHKVPIELSLSTFLDDGRRQALAIIRDISERKKGEAKRLELEEQLRQKYKIEAVGLLAGGIAHNFNNNLAIILGNVEMAKHKDVGPEDAEILLDHAYTAARRASDLVKQIMTYSRADNMNAEPVRLRLILEETLGLLTSTMPSSVTLHVHFHPQAHNIFVDANATSIQEILINLCNNAVHAMDESGDLTVSLDLTDLEAQDIPAQFSCPPGRYARLAVADTGSGMSDDMMAKIFDPFFTTKDVDEGTGMGLATVMGTVKNYGGLVKVDSRIGQGTRFDVLFPVLGGAQSEHRNDDIAVYKGSGKILLVDDDPMLAEISRKMLDKLGYRVTVETSSIQALNRLAKDPFKFDLVISDQTMPRMTGVEFAEQVRQINRELPIILCTGFSTRVSERDYQNYNVKAFCMKPLTLSELSAAVRKALTQ